MRIDGSCHCGAVSFSAEIDPDRVMVCHCTDCQVLLGAPFRAVVAAPIETLGGQRADQALHQGRAKRQSPRAGLLLGVRHAALSDCAGEPDLGNHPARLRAAARAAEAGGADLAARGAAVGVRSGLRSRLAPAAGLPAGCAAPGRLMPRGRSSPAGGSRSACGLPIPVEGDAAIGTLPPRLRRGRVALPRGRADAASLEFDRDGSAPRAPSLRTP